MWKASHRNDASGCIASRPTFQSNFLTFGLLQRRPRFSLSVAQVGFTSDNCSKKYFISRQTTAIFPDWWWMCLASISKKGKTKTSNVFETFPPFPGMRKWLWTSLSNISKNKKVAVNQERFHIFFCFAISESETTDSVWRQLISGLLFGKIMCPVSR